MKGRGLVRKEQNSTKLLLLSREHGFSVGGNRTLKKGNYVSLSRRGGGKKTDGRKKTAADTRGENCSGHAGEKATRLLFHG